MKIEPATAADLPALYEMNELFNGEGQTDRDTMAQNLHNPAELVLIARAEGEAAGFCCCQLLRSVCYRGDYVELMELFVKERFRRRGVGEGLVGYAVEQFAKQGVRYFHLATGADNRSAQALYEKMGFAKNGYRYTLVYSKGGEQ